MRRRVRAFEPDVVILALRDFENRGVIGHLSRLTQAGVPLDDGYLRRSLEAIGLDQKTNSSTVMRRLSTVADDLVNWTIRTLMREIRESSAIPVAVAMRLPGDQSYDVLHRIATAEEAGGIAIDMTSPSGGRDESQLRLADWDHHPNAAPFAGGRTVPPA